MIERIAENVAAGAMWLLAAVLLLAGVAFGVDAYASMMAGEPLRLGINLVVLAACWFLALALAMVGINIRRDGL